MAIKGCVSLVTGIKDFFGINNSEMITEFKALTAEDRAFFRTELCAQGYDIQAAPTVAGMPETLVASA